MANRLGKAFRYVAEAYQYAASSIKSLNPMLRRVLFDATRTGSRGGDQGDVDFYLRLAATNPAVFGALTTIADRISDSELFIIQEKQGSEWIDLVEHPFSVVLRHPNSIMSGSLLLSDTAWWYKLLGNAYWFLVTDTPGYGPIREIWPLPADRVYPDPISMRISPVTGKPILDYNYTLGGMITLPGENIVHFRTANPFDAWRGLSPLSALQGNLKTDQAQVSWMGSYYGKGNAVPASVISLPANINDEDFEAVKQDIEEQFGGKRQTAVVRSGDFKVEVIQHSIADMQVIDHRKYSKQEVREVFKIPEGLTGATSGQSRLAAETALARDAIQPLINYFAETISRFALPLYDRDSDHLRCHPKNVIPQDIVLEISKYKTYGVDRTINENRHEQGLKAILLPAELAMFQVLYDYVPQGMIPTIAPVIVQKVAPPPAPAALPGTALVKPSNPMDDLIAHLSGGGQWQVSPPPQIGDNQNSQASMPGSRISGLPNAIDPIQQMLGNKAADGNKPLSDAEQDAMLFSMLNTYVKASASQDRKQLVLTALLYSMQQVDNQQEA